MADDSNLTRYGVDAGLSVLGLALGIATGDKELTRSAYKSASDTTRTLAGTNQPAGTFEPPRNVPGKPETTVVAPTPAPPVNAAPAASAPVRATVAAANTPPATASTIPPSGRFDPFTLEPR